MSKDYYKILGVDRSSSEDEIKKAYRKLSKQFHPDLNKSKDAESKFKDINQAYEILGDKDKKYKYDNYNISDDSQFGGFDQGSYGNEGSPFDIFSEFFSQGPDNAGDFFAGFGSGAKSGRTQQSQQITKQTVYITFLESINGCLYKFNYKQNTTCSDCKGKKSYQGDSQHISKCIQCNGSGVEIVQAKSVFGIINTKQKCRKCYGEGQKILKTCKKCFGKGYMSKDKTVEIKIPPGIKNNEMLLFKDPDSYNGEKIYLEIIIRPSEVFQRKDNDIYTKIIINPLIAILGGEIDIPTPSGIKKTKIDPGTQLGDYLKIKGQGVVRKNKFVNGDLYVKVLFSTLKLSKEDLQKLKSIKITDSEQGKEWIKKATKELK